MHGTKLQVCSYSLDQVVRKGEVHFPYIIFHFSFAICGKQFVHSMRHFMMVLSAD